MSIKGNTVGHPLPDPRKGLNMTGPINMNGQALRGLNAPTADDQAVNLGFVKNMGKAKAGFIYPLAASVVPEGFLLCDGAAYSRTEYPELFAAIGTMYGSGDGSTTFNVPDITFADGVGAIIATGKGTGVSIADIIMGAQALPLGIPYGGTGAVDAKTARENLKITPENIGALAAIESSEYPGCYYRIVDGMTEWLNPPMVIGTEYRTTERFNCKAVYQNVISFGALPNYGQKEIVHGIGFTALVSDYAVMRVGASIGSMRNYPGIVCCYTSATRVFVEVSENLSVWTDCYFILKYTKD